MRIYADEINETIIWLYCIAFNFYLLRLFIRKSLLWLYEINDNSHNIIWYDDLISILILIPISNFEYNLVLVLI